MNLFKITDNGIIVISDEARNIEIFNTILVRDKGSKGDSQGRKKQMSNKEIAFVYYYCDWKSDFKNYNEDERIERIIMYLGIGHIDSKWRPDDVVMLACEVYNSLQKTPSIIAFSETREGLFSAMKLIKILRIKIEKDIKKFEEIFAEEDNDVTVDAKMLSASIKSMQEMISLSKDIPNAIENITKLEDNVKKEMSSNTKLKGEGKKGMYEDGF
jgi:hypothetical protein